MNDVRDMREQTYELIDWIAKTGTDPACWPLSQDDQISFIRHAIARALAIRNCEHYRADLINVARAKLEDAYTDQSTKGTSSKP